MDLDEDELKATRKLHGLDEQISKADEIIGKRVITYDGHTGTVIERFNTTGRNMSVHIQEDDGRIWACPETDIVDFGGKYE